MKNKLILTFLSLLLVAGNASAQKSVVKSFDSWPMGLSVSLVMPSEKLEQVKNAGFNWVEVTLNSQRTTSKEVCLAAIERFRTEAERIGFRIWSVHLPFGREWDISSPDEAMRSQRVERIAWFIEVVKGFGAQKLILHPSAEPIADAERKAHIKACVRSINELAKMARGIGAQLIIEDLPRTCLGNTSQELLAIMGRIDRRVGVCFDTNHLLRELPQEFAATIGSRIESLHVSDYDKVDERHWLIGRGVIDWPSLIAAIAATGYDGVFMFEVGGYDSFAQIADTWHSMRERLAAEQKK